MPSSLVNTLNDARDMAHTLKTEMGFTVTTVENATRRQLAKSVQRFIRDIQGTRGVALIYYSGHGMQGPYQRNYLVPVDAEISDEMDTALEGLALDELLAGLNQRSSNAVNIVILDACRNNPFAAGSKSLGHKGLSKLKKTPSGTLILYATQPNEVASDNPTGRNGLFTKHLLNVMREPGLPVELAFKRIGLAVYNESQQQQHPWSEGAILGEFAFVKKEEVANLEPTPAASPQTPTSGDAYTSQSAEMRFWDEVKDSQNPVYLQAYLDRYPQGAFVLFAKDKLAKLSPASPPTTTSKPDITEQSETVKPVLPILTLRSTVSNDEVFIDGEPYGKTSLYLPLEPGTYQIRIEKEGYMPFEQQVMLNGNHTVWAKLKKEYTILRQQNESTLAASKNKLKSSEKEVGGIKVVTHEDVKAADDEARWTVFCPHSRSSLYIVGITGKSTARKAFYKKDKETGGECNSVPILIKEGGPCKSGFCFEGPAEKHNKKIIQLINQAESGSATAQYEIGQEYYKGNLLLSDSSKATFWYKKAAKQEHVDAMYALGMLLKNRDSKDANAWLEKVALRKHGKAQYELGDNYRFGRCGLEKDIDTAIKWFNKAVVDGGNSTSAKQKLEYLCGKGYSKAC